MALNYLIFFLGVKLLAETILYGCIKYRFYKVNKRFELFWVAFKTTTFL